MNGYIVYLAVQQTTAEFAHEARPGARVQSRAVADGQRGRGVVVRQQMSSTLRRLADRIEPRPAQRPLPASSGR
jgi:hypothetical protein